LGTPARRRLCLALSLPALFALAVGSVEANNGINQIGFGTESALMAGADTAMARDTSALNTNPAGLSQLSAGRVDVYLASAFIHDGVHRDGLGNDRQVTNKVIPVAGLGLAHRISGGPVVAGIGMFFQGGSGAQFENLATPFGGRDQLTALFGVGKLTGGLSWEVTPKLSLGVGVSAVVAVAEQKIFPNSSNFDAFDPTRTFFGVSVDNVRASRSGYRLGAQYQLSPSVRLGFVFANRVALPLTDGQARVNMSSVGLGTVTYGNARLEGLAIPREISVGATWAATDATLLSFKVSRLGWARAFDSIVLDASGPDNAFAPSGVRQVTDITARDRTIYALGVRHALDDRLVLYAGFNYMKQPFEVQTLSPTLAPIGEKHLTLGATRQFGERHHFAAGLEYLFPAEVRYTNPQVPLGPGLTARLEYIAFHAMYSYAW